MTFKPGCIQLLLSIHQLQVAIKVETDTKLKH